MNRILPASKGAVVLAVLAKVPWTMGEVATELGWSAWLFCAHLRVLMIRGYARREPFAMGNRLRRFVWPAVEAIGTRCVATRCGRSGYAVFDFAVLTASRKLQEIVGAKVDGAVGAQTLERGLAFVGSFGAVQSSDVACNSRMTCLRARHYLLPGLDHPCDGRPRPPTDGRRGRHRPGRRDGGGPPSLPRG